MRLPAVVVLMLGLLAAAQAQEARCPPLIANPVGYFTAVVPASTAVPVASPLACDAILEDQLEPGDQIRVWDAAVQEYTVISRTPSGWDGKMSLLPGQALWLENRHKAAKTVVLAGCLPLQSPAFLDIRSGFNLFGLPYLNPLSLDDTPFAKDGAVPGDLKSADQVIESENSRYWWLTANGLWQGSELGADDQLQPFCGFSSNVNTHSHPK